MDTSVVATDFDCALCGKHVRGAYAGRHLGLCHKDIDPEQFFLRYLSQSGPGACAECGQPTQFKSAARGYRKFCSPTCLNRHNMRDPVVLAKVAAGVSRAMAGRKLTDEHRAAIGRASRRSHAAGVYRDNPAKISAANRNSTAHFIAKARAIHGGRYDYSKSTYTGISNPIEVICASHGSFWQRAGDHINSAHPNGCPRCAHIISRPELDIKALLESAGATVIHRDRQALAPTELDLYLPDRQLAIEYCGLRWHAEQMSGGRLKHRMKFEQCRAAGIRLITIFEDEWIMRRAVVESKLLYLIGQCNRRVAARRCTVTELSHAAASQFLAMYHLQGSDTAPARYGLMHDGELVAVATFARPSRSGGDRSCDWNVSRFAALPRTAVVGGWQRLLRRFERDHSPRRLLTYADLRWSVGDLYRTSGFTHSHNTPPNYWYVPVNGGRRYHRYGFRRSELPRRLEHFDPALTEYRNMLANGWDRIWDCGNSAFTRDYGSRAAA